MGRFRVLVSVVLALATAVPLLATAAPAVAATGHRLHGVSRIETAAAIARHAFPDGSSAVYLARADVFADALAAGTLRDGPVLLVPSCGDVPAVVAGEIGRLDPDRVVALGGARAVCDAVLGAAAAGRPTARLAGASRAETAVRIAQAAFPDGAATVYLARDSDSPDAVAGGSLTGGPILLVPAGGPVPPVVAGEIERLGADRVVALGGTAALSEAVLNAAADGRGTGRLAGASRVHTAAAIAAATFPGDASEVYLARGDVFADAVAAGSLTAGPVLLVPSCGPVPDIVSAAIRRMGPDRVVALGGEAAVCPALLDSAAAADQREAIIPDTTVVLDEQARGALVDRDADGTLTFTGPEAPDLSPGDVLVSEEVPEVAPQGLLRTVTSVRAAGGEVVVETAPAALTDAVHRGSTSLSATLTPDDILTERFAEPMRTAAAAGGRRLAADRQPAADLTVPLVDLRLAEEAVLYDRDADPTTTDDQVSLSGRFTFAAELFASLDIDLGGLPPRPRVTEFLAVLDVGQSAGLTLTAAEGLTWTPRPITLWEAELRCFKAQLGYVPVLLCPEIEVSIDGAGAVQATVTTGVEQTATGRLGMRYAEGWAGIAEHSLDIGATPPVLTATADARSSIRAEVEVEVYDVDGPYVWAQASGRGEGRLRNTVLCWGIHGGIAAGVGIELDDIPWLGDDLPSLPDRQVLGVERLLLEGGASECRGPRNAPAVLLVSDEGEDDLVAVDPGSGRQTSLGGVDALGPHSWLGDTGLVAPRGGTFGVLDLATGAFRPVAEVAGGGLPSPASVDPTGSRFAYTTEVYPEGGRRQEVVTVVDLATGASREVFRNRDTSYSGGHPMAFSPDGGALLVRSSVGGSTEGLDDSRGQIFVIDLATGRAGPVAQGDIDASWSADGSRIATVEQSNGWRGVVTDRSGRALRVVAGGAATSLAFSPAADRLAVVSGRSAWVETAGGGMLAGVDLGGLAYTAVGDPTWSPDGQTLLLSVTRPFQTSTPTGLAVWEPDSGIVREVFAPTTVSRDQGVDATWLPDSQRIAVVASGVEDSLWIATRAGGAPARLGQWQSAWLTVRG